ncbi:MAG TPA: alcohol dehydrogenase catalytic domain-containing protein [Blastocatellia bacterium]|nr:alcohol dehydrogenase catalytic domain-containing protein [Blastocatellia bacterium]
MQALKKRSLTEDGLQFVETEPEPRVGHSDVKIRVEAASICGTDQSIYQITSRPGMRDEMLAYNGGDVARYQPIIVGHEFCGEVAELGEDVDPGLVRIGDYVTSEMHISCGHCQQCRTGQRHICKNIRVKGLHLDGAFAEYVVVPSENLINLEDFGGREVIPPRFGAFLDALGNAVHTVMEGGVEGKTVAILGCGAQGLMAAAVARTLGATRIYITDFSNPHGSFSAEHLANRFKTARELGADFCFDTNEDAAPGQRKELFERASSEHGGGIDVILEMSGAEAAYNDAGGLVKNGGQILLLGIPARPLRSFDFGKYAVWKGVTIKGIFGRRMFETWHAMLDLLASEKSQLKERLEKIITREPVPLSEFERGFEMVRSHEAVKLFLAPDGGNK